MQYLKEDNGPALVQFESQCPRGSREFDGVPITSEAGIEKQFSNIRAVFLQNLMSELECRFPAVATDVVTCMSVLSLRGLSFLSEGNTTVKCVINLSNLVKTDKVSINYNTFTRYLNKKHELF